MKLQPKLKVVVQTEEGGVVWEENAATVSSENSQGAFDILPQHANFITLVREKPIIVRSHSEEKTLTFPVALVYVKENTVRIFALSAASGKKDALGAQSSVKKAKHTPQRKAEKERGR